MGEESIDIAQTAADGKGGEATVVVALKVLLAQL